MALRAELFDGTVLEFPDGTDQEVVDRVAREETLARRPQPAPVQPSTKRTVGEAITDIGAGVLGGLGGVAQVPGQLLRLVPGMAGVGEALAKPGEMISEAGESLKSEGLKAREALRNQALSEAEKDGILAQFGTAITSTLKDPALITSFFAEQVPLLLGPAGAVKLTQILGRGAVEAAGKGLAGTAAQEAQALAAQQLSQRASRAAIGTGAAMQGADVSGDAYQAALEKAKAQGMSDEQAQEAAINAARIAGAGAGAASLATAGLLSKVGGTAVERRLAGVPGATRPISAAGEATSESLEEAAGQLFRNISLRQIDPSQSLTEGVGAAAGLGALGGAFFGGLLGGKPKEALAPGQREGESLTQTANRLGREITSLEQQINPPEEPRQIATLEELMNLAAQPQGWTKLLRYEDQLKTLPESPERDEAIRITKELRGRLTAEEVSRKTPEGKEYPHGVALPEPVEEQQYPSATQLIEMINKMEGVEQALAELDNYASAIRNLPATKDRADHLRLVSELKQIVKSEAAGREIKPAKPFVLSKTDLNNAGITRSDILHHQLSGKDLNNPDQADYVVRQLENALTRKGITQEKFGLIQGLLETVDSHLQDKLGSAFYAQRTVTEPSGAGAGVVSGEVAKPATEGPAKPKRNRVVRPTAYVGPSVSGEEGKPASVEEGPPPFVEGPEPGLQTAYTPKELEDFKREIKRSERQIRGLKRPRGAGNLFGVLTGKVDLQDVKDIGSSKGIVERQFRPLINSVRGKIIADIVSDGTLDDFLPPGMRHDHPEFDAQESEEYIKDKLRQRDHLSFEASMAIKELNVSIDTLEAVLTESEIQNEIEGLLRETNFQLQQAADEQRERAEEAEGAKAEAPTRGTARVAGKKKAEGLTERQQKIKFAEATGAADKEQLKSRRNPNLLAAVKAGNVKGVANVLSKSKNKLIAFIGQQGIPAGVTIKIDDEAGETFLGRSFALDQITINFAKNILALRDAFPANSEFTIIDVLNDEGDTQEIVTKPSELAQSALTAKYWWLYGFKSTSLVPSENLAALKSWINSEIERIGEDKLKLNATASAVKVGVPGGAYNADTKEILLDSWWARSEGVVGHEVVHAQTMAAIANPTAAQQPYVKQLNDLYQHVKQQVSALKTNARFPDLYEFYGLSSLQEFMAEGMSNPRFQFLLNSIPYKQKSAWSNFVDTVAKILGIKDNTAFTELVSIYESLTTPKKSLREVTKTVPAGKFKELEERAKKPQPEKVKPEPVEAPEVTTLKTQKKLKAAQLEDVLKRILNQYGLKGVELNLEEGMQDEGSYSGMLIKMALDNVDPARVLRHESVHALKELGFFTPQQWKVLTDRANKEWIDTYLKNRNIDGNPLEPGQQSRYEAYMDLYKGDEEAVMEEAIADAFAYFSQAKAPAGLMQSILTRMNNLFKAIKQAMNLGGYETAEDVFGAIEKGKLTGFAPVATQPAKASLRNIQTDSANFKKWFGDSKVVDEDGNPLVMYHGTTKNFSVFETKGGAIFVTPSQSFANKFAMDDMLFTGTDTAIAPSGANVMPVYVRAEQPFDFENPSDIRKVKKLLDPADQKRFADGAASGRWQDIEDFLGSIEDAGFDSVYIREQGIKNLAVFSPTQLKSATGNIGTFDITSPDIRKSIRAPKTPQFEAFFGESKIVNDKGEPRVMYHGTARDITEFRPQQANAIFVSPNPEISAGYAQQSAQWMANHAEEFLTPKQLKETERITKGLLRDNGYSARQIAALQADNEFKKTDEYKEAVSRYMPSGPNIIPVFVRAENPFDYDDKVMRQLVLQRLNENRTTKLLDGYFSNFNNWEAIEDPETQRVLREMGFDSFYVRENGIKNLAVYSPSQIKSATGNEGTFDIKSPDIRKSLRTMPTFTQDINYRVTSTVIPRFRPGFVERIQDALTPRTYSKFRAEFINRFEVQAKNDRAVAEQIKLMGGTEQLADTKAESAALFADLGGGLAAAAYGVHDRVGGIPVYQRRFAVEKDFVRLSEHPTRAAAQAAAQRVGGQVYEVGHTVVSNANGEEGLIAIFSPLMNYKKPVEGEPDVWSLYQFWADVKRASKFILNPNTGKYEEKLFNQSDITRAKEIERQFPEFVDIQKKWIKYNNGLVDFMRDTGVISEQGAIEMKRHGDYFPFYRHLGENDTQGPKLFSSIAGVKSPRAAKGSEAEVTDFFETIVRNTQSAIQAGIKNIAGRRATDQALRIGMVTKMSKPTSGPAAYRILEDGKEVYYEANDLMFVESLKALNQPDLPFIGLLAKPAQLLRTLVTKDPAFMLANMMRDSVSAWQTSGVKMTPIAATLKQFASVLRGSSPELEALYKAGVIGGYDYSHGVEVSAQKLEKEMRKAQGVKSTIEKLATPVTSLWGALEKGSSASDAATRMEIYKKVLAETGNEAEALWQSLEVMNFNRKGRSPIIRLLTAAVPFMNARIQGLDVLYRAGIRPALAADTTQAERERFRTFWVRGMTMMSLAAMYWALTHDDDDYKKQEQETRDNYWLIPSLGIKIPIAFEVGFMFKVVPERILEYAFGSDTGEDFLKSMGRQLHSTLSVGFPQVANPLIELTTNYSFFTQRPIIGQGMENISPEYQVGPNTSKVAGAIGQSLGISPMKLDHLIQGYTGTMGMYAVQLMDSFLDMNSDAPKASKRFEQMPVIRRFLVDPEARGQVTGYYDLKRSIDEAVRTSNYLERSQDFAGYTKYVQENMNMLSTRDYINDLEKSMKEFREYKNMIRISAMDADAKRDALVSIGKMEQQITANIQSLKKTIASR